MRHRKAGRKLNRTSSHRVAMLRNMVTEFLDKERIVTTVPKAKELRPYAEKIITLGKRESLHARRQALAVIRRKSVVHKLFDSLAPRFADREGGYTRIVRLGNRKGDAAEMALIELIGSELEPEPEKKRGRSKKRAAKKTVEPLAAKAGKKSKKKAEKKADEAESPRASSKKASAKKSEAKKAAPEADETEAAAVSEEAEKDE